MTMLQKAKIFVTDAGKVIMIISIVLWFLSSYGPSNKMEPLQKNYEAAIQANPSNTAVVEKQYHTDKLANSYAGIIGKQIEPIIQPLGYDWKIGIALVTSFAAREVAGSWETGRTFAIIGAWLVVGLIWAIRSFKWERQ